MRPASAIGALAAATLLLAAGSLVRAQDSLLRSLPQVQRLYQERLEQLKSGRIPEVFVGTASVCPRNCQHYMASIGLAGVPQERGHFCAGVIVAPHWILTAAHCVSTGTGTHGKSRIAPLKPDAIQVLTGSNVLFRGKPKPVGRIMIHPQHRITSRGVPEYDLALLQVSDTLAAAELKIATGAQAAALLKSGDKLRIEGWGTATFTANAPVSANLLFAYVDVVDHAKCNKTYYGAVTDRMFCAGVGAADSCQGDSGGPAIGYIGGEPYLVGITSWGAGCTRKNYPGVYVNVAKLRGWIDETIGKTAQ